MLLARFVNNHWHNFSTITDIILQQSLAQLFSSRWCNSSTVTGTIVQQPLARLFNSHQNNSSRVTGASVQRSLARLFSSHWHYFSTVTGRDFCFFNAGRILQQWCLLLKTCGMHREYDTWSVICLQNFFCKCDSFVD